MSNTTIRLRESGVAGNVPSTLAAGELAINHADGKLYYGNTTNVAKLFGAITEPAGIDGEIQINSSGSFGADANLRFLTSTNTLHVDNILLISGQNVSSTLTNSYNQANAAYNQANTALDSAIAMAIALG